MVLFVSNIFLGGYLIRIWERFGERNPFEGFDSYQNCMWYAFITMSTVGYGDMFAKSLAGRLLATLVAVLGVFINSTLTVIMTDNFTFKGGELKAYNMLNQIEMRERLDLIVRMLITRCVKIYSVKKQRLKNLDLNKVKHSDTIDRFLLRQRDMLLKRIKEVKEKVRTCFKAEPIDMVIDKLVDVRKAVKLIKDTIDTFEEVIEMNNENHRNMDALANTVKSINFEN
jgi:hypothetical protein